MDIYNKVKMNHSDCTIEFFHEQGNSKLIIDGLDDKERVEKILGLEYATIFLNEVSQIPYDTVETVSTRLNAPKGVPLRMIFDYNPPSMQHWGYKIFHQRKFLNGTPVPKDDYAWIQLNPKDNEKNLSKDYIPGLQNLSIAKRKRFLLGEYGTDEGALWKREWIKYGNQDTHLLRVVVGVDPSGSTLGDEIGIICAALGKDRKVYILDDYSLHGTPKEWSDEVFSCYDTFQGDVVAAEKNYGGEMVESTITQFGDKNINVKLVNATRGKAVRAEPVSAMYERGEIIHTHPMLELEDELCTWKPLEDKKSPNRLDALVWAITELMNEATPYEEDGDTNKTGNLFDEDIQ
jgi:PBSX family phage terminase large subunit